MGGEPVKILLVDDHAVVRLGLRTLLEASGPYKVVGEAATANEAVNKATELKPDVVLMDVRLPDRSGVEACRDIRSSSPTSQVLMLTSYPDDDAMLASVLAGACGYLLKEINPDKLLNAIQVVSQGGSLLDSSLIKRVLTQISTAQPTDPEPFSEQEKKVLDLIAMGKTNREIGETMFLSENTVKHYVSRVLSKLNLSHRSEAAVYWSKRQNKSD